MNPLMIDTDIDIDHEGWAIMMMICPDVLGQQREILILGFWRDELNLDAVGQFGYFSLSQNESN